MESHNRVMSCYNATLRFRLEFLRLRKQISKLSSRINVLKGFIKKTFKKLAARALSDVKPSAHVLNPIKHSCSVFKYYICLCVFVDIPS